MAGAMRLALLAWVASLHLHGCSAVQQFLSPPQATLLSPCALEQLHVSEARAYGTRNADYIELQNTAAVACSLTGVQLGNTRSRSHFSPSNFVFHGAVAIEAGGFWVGNDSKPGSFGLELNPAGDELHLCAPASTGADCKHVTLRAAAEGADQMAQCFEAAGPLPCFCSPTPGETNAPCSPCYCGPSSCHCGADADQEGRRAVDDVGDEGGLSTGGVSSGSAPESGAVPNSFWWLFLGPADESLFDESLFWWLFRLTCIVTAVGYAFRGLNAVVAAGFESPQTNWAGSDHQQQEAQFCAVHALNNLFGVLSETKPHPEGHQWLFSPDHLDAIANQLHAKDPSCPAINPYRSSLGLGNYDVQVVQAVVEGMGYQWSRHRGQVMDIDTLDLGDLTGIVIQTPGAWPGAAFFLPPVRHFATGPCRPHCV